MKDDHNLGPRVRPTERRAGRREPWERGWDDHRSFVYS